MKTCRARHWPLLAAHIRSTHLHAILETPIDPESSMGELKSECTKALKAANLAGPEDRIWADYGNIRILRSAYVIAKAIDYVLHRQGAPMETYSDASDSEVSDERPNTERTSTQSPTYNHTRPTITPGIAGGPSQP
ncbi:hypothetical protein [uncultured Paludibaculum sp.]|uniref:hypothetical protein n=1 Tax=uncultured Paludibaculum sp. TaxID=1765020 RepID=UPI002AABDA5E|nr:hypothetical protein [uncultured Paludibaculum sp.]